MFGTEIMTSVIGTPYYVAPEVPWKLPLGRRDCSMRNCQRSSSVALVIVVAIVATGGGVRGVGGIR